MGDPKGFLKYAREGPKRKPVELRVLDWKEMYEPIAEDKLKVQGARCMDCGVPFCQGNTGCPVVNLIPEWNDLVYRGRWKDALKALHTTNNFPEFTGRLCPAPCEGACVLGINSDPVSIRVLEWNIIDRGFNEGLVEPAMPVRKTGKTVAIIGSGPAGLAAAQQLARAGHTVTVFEKSDRIGGLLRYGIPDFKMEKWVIDRRLEQMKAEGVEFKTGVTVGKDITGEQLRQQFDAVGLTMGAEMARDLPVPGRELKGIHFAMEYLTQQNKRTAGISVSEEPITAKGKRVIIIGGGDTGSDCLGTAHRQGCSEAHQFEVLPEPPPRRVRLRRLGRSGPCNFARRMRTKKAAIASGASPPPSLPAITAMSPSCMPIASSSRAASSCRCRIRTLNWMRTSCCSPWVSRARSETVFSTASASPTMRAVASPWTTTS
jgi:glutamate synthase (NADPH/NADH) small chain